VTLLTRTWGQEDKEMATETNSRIVAPINLMLIVLLSCPFAYSRTVYVDDDAAGANNGTNWANAYWCLQDALSNAQAGDEIRVACGTYKPDRRVIISRSRRQITASGDRAATFHLINGVDIRGGYAGFGETDPDARDVLLYQTILSGDLNSNDGPNFTNNSDNSYHVVISSGTNETAVLDGFTITAGNANGFSDNSGAGMYNDRGSPTVTNCTFTYNSGVNGGGMCNSESSPVLTNCIFNSNLVSNMGGGMFNYGLNSKCNPMLINCTFNGNLALDGGGMLNGKQGNAILTNCTFTRNHGYGIICDNSQVTVVNTILWNNSPFEIYLAGGSIDVSYSDVRNGWLGIGNIDADPLFVDADGLDDIPGTGDDDLHLLPGSPCINAGDNSAITQSVTTDLDGNPRIINRTVDMGAYEADVVPTINILYVDAVNGNDNNNGLTVQTAFATIQKSIDTAADSDIVLVYPGLYQEEINFMGKKLSLQGVAISPAGVPVLHNPGDFAVSFYSGETPDSILKNFIIKDSFMGVFIADSSPTLINLTIVGNKYGIEAYAGSDPVISNTILWNNTDSDLFGCRARYSCVERGGEDNLTADPLFVDPENGDYHIRSERGRYWPRFDIWVLDKVTSPCVDAGDPNADPSDEPLPNGGRINIGAYGGTPEASLSPAQSPTLIGKASNPYPADGAENVDINVTLSWTAGFGGALHNVYLGTDFDQVRQSNLGSMLVGQQSGTNYDPGTLNYNETYYWRIDEVDNQGMTITGEVWSFTTTSSPGPPKGRSCFTGNTPVWADGALIPISQITSGNIITEMHGHNRIEEVQEHTGMFVCYDILLESGNCLGVAENHYFLVESEEWISLRNLKAGAKLKTTKGSIGIVRVTKRPMPYIGKVYNLKIDGSDRYLVGKDAIIVRDY
jgi:hypothetical protein